MSRVGALCWIATLLTSCVDVGAFQCASNEDCSEGAQGICEATLYCSYPDDSCESSRRYSQLAGPQANRCTEPSDPTSGTSTSTSSASAGPSTTQTSVDTTETTMGTSSGESTGSPPQPGGVVWSFLHNNADRDDSFEGVASLDGVSYVVAGWVRAPDENEKTYVARYSDRDEVLWSDSRDDTGFGGRALALTQTPEAEVLVAGRYTTSTTERPFVGCYFPASGDLCWPAHQFTNGNVGIDVVAVPVNPRGGVVVGLDYGMPTSAWAGAIDLDGVVLWTNTGVAWRFDSGVARGAQILVGGRMGQELYLGEVSDSGFAELFTGQFGDGGSIQSLALVDDTLFAGGYVVTAGAHDAWLARFSVDGTMTWSEPMISGLDKDDEIEALALDEEGNVVTAGFTTGVEKELWVAKWSPDGQQLWSQNYADLGVADRIARDVAIVADDHILVVGETRTDRGDLDGFAMLLTP